MKNLADGLRNAQIEVHQFMLGTPGHPIPADIPKGYPFSVLTENLDTQVRPIGAFLNLVSSNASYNIARFRSERIAGILLNRIKAERYDIVQAESIFALELIYPILDKITKTQGFTTYFYSQTMVDYDKPKLVFCKSGYPMATYIDEPMNLSDNMMYYLPINEIEGRNLEFIINSEVFGQAIQMFSTNARDAHKTIVKLKKIDLSVTPLENEDQILEIFRR